MPDFSKDWKQLQAAQGATPVPTPDAGAELKSLLEAHGAPPKAKPKSSKRPRKGKAPSVAPAGSGIRPSATLLPDMLQMAVPLWVRKVRGYSDAERAVRLKAVVDIVAFQGDILLFGSKTKGAAGNVFNHLAEGIALLSLVPGGVKTFGMRFDASDGSLGFPKVEA